MKVGGGDDVEGSGEGGIKGGGEGSNGCVIAGSRHTSGM